MLSGFLRLMAGLWQSPFTLPGEDWLLFMRVDANIYPPPERMIVTFFYEPHCGLNALSRSKENLSPEVVYEGLLNRALPREGE